MKTKILVFSLLLLAKFQDITAQSEEKRALIIEYLEKSKQLTQQHPDSSLQYVEMALRASSEMANDTLVAKSYLQKSRILIIKRDFAKADSILQLNLKKNFLAISEVRPGIIWEPLSTTNKTFKKH